MPRLVDHAERRLAIVSAAWRLIAARGIDSTNMRDLAREAGYTNGALSHYFSGKNEILRAAFEHVFERNQCPNPAISRPATRFDGATATVSGSDAPDRRDPARGADRGIAVATGSERSAHGVGELPARWTRGALN